MVKLLNLLNLFKRSNRHILKPGSTIKIRIVNEPEDWFNEDAGNLESFLLSGTGQKLLANLEHSIYLESFSRKELSSWEDGRRAGMAYAVTSLRDLATIIHPDEDEDEDEEDAN